MIDKSLVAYNNNRSDGRDDDYHSGQLRTHSVIILSETIRELLPLNCALILQKKDISDFHHYLLDEKGFSSGTITIYVSLFKKMCRIAFERGLCKNLLFAHYRVGTPRVTTPRALSMSDFIKIRDVELPEDKPRLSVSR